MNALADRYAAFLLDLDGVVYRGHEAIPGAPEAVAGLRDRGGRVVFVTNNSAPTPEQVVDTLTSMGVKAEPGDVVTSAQAVAPMVRRRVGEGAEVFAVGEGGLRRALEEAGLRLSAPDAERAAAVVVGWDRSADFDRLRRAGLLVQRGAPLFAANADRSYPAPGGELWPGTGALLGVIEATTGVRAEVAGKPHRPLFEAALERAGTARALMVGDRLETDVAGAAAAGLDAVVVLSGAATRADLLDHDALPVDVLPDVSGLLEDRPEAAARGAG
ncbi:MAG TPA: HAD-IIA family hydrolase, partial [Actinomycetota bacterium]